MISYFKLFKIKNIKWTKEGIDEIYGTVVFIDNEKQDFCWHMTEQKVPSDDTIALIKIINKKGLFDIDKININSEELFLMTGWTNKKKFEESMNELYEIEVKMIDNYEETDSFFIHN